MRVLKENDLAVEICRMLQSESHQALMVGGCVRDAMLGVAPKDFDVATSAIPVEIEAACSKRFKLDLVGKAFGVIVATDGDERVEIATFRQDTAGRKPGVSFVPTVEQDACRRDFTINAMYFDPVMDAVIDPTGGVDDMQACVLRTPGDPFDRMSEDVLRTLRAARFAARFAFHLESGLEDAMKANSSLVGVIEQGVIGRIPQERVVAEFKAAFKQIPADRIPMYISILEHTGLFGGMFPGVPVPSLRYGPSYFFAVREMFGDDVNAAAANGFGNDETAFMKAVGYVKSVGSDLGLFEADRISRAVSIIGDHGVRVVLSRNADDTADSILRFVQGKMRADGDTVMRETGLPRGKELGAEMRRRNMETFMGLFGGN